MSMRAIFCVLGESQVRGAAGEGCPGAPLGLLWSCTGAAIRPGLLWHSIPSPPPFPRKAEGSVGAATPRVAALPVTDRAKELQDPLSTSGEDP